MVTPKAGEPSPQKGAVVQAESDKASQRQEATRPTQKIYRAQEVARRGSSYGNHARRRVWTTSHENSS